MTIAIQKLNQRHYKILEFCLRGWTVKQIAEHLHMSPQQVSVVIKSPTFDHQLAIRRAKVEGMVNQSVVSADDEVTDALRKGAKDACDKLLGGLKSTDEGIVLRSSESILDRTGYPKVHQVESKSLSVVLTGEDARRIQETMAMDVDGDA